MAIENELSFNDYLSILKRRWSLMLVVFVLAVVTSIALAFLMPSVYLSVGTISVEAQRIPTDLVQSTAVSNYANERIDSIKERVMSKESLQRIIQKYGLYPGVDPKKAINKLANSITIKLLTKSKSDDQWSNEKVTIAFDVGFEYTDPEVTHKVTNELVTLFLDENVKVRTKRATETTEFLTEEADRLKADLEAVENKVAAYKQAHANSLPENVQMYMNMLQNLESDMKEVDRDYKSTQEELRYLDVEMTTTSAAMKSGEDVSGNTVSELDKAKAELERALVLYKDTHPTVRALKRKIEVLENSSQTPDAAKPAKTNLATELALSKIQAQIDAAKARLISLADQKKSMHARMAQLQAQVVQTPQVERGLFTLLRDYENAKSKYDEVKSKQVNAKIAQNLEMENKAERFSLLVAPEFPESRFKPQRKKIVGMGVLAGLVLSGALAAILELLDKRVRSVGALTSIINMRPLVIIPYISTQTELKHKQRLKKSAIVAAVICLVLSIIIGLIVMKIV